jgi:leucyl-tRNA synthetase
LPCSLRRFGRCLKQFIPFSPLFPPLYFWSGQASADKIVREIELFGPNFEKFEEASPPEEPTVTTTDPVSANSAVKVDKGKKGKLAAKSTGHRYQFQILESIGVPRAEIKKFADPYHWVAHFIPLAVVCGFFVVFLE